MNKYFKAASIIVTNMDFISIDVPVDFGLLLREGDLVYLDGTTENFPDWIISDKILLKDLEDTCIELGPRHISKDKIEFYAKTV